VPNLIKLISCNLLFYVFNVDLKGSGHSHNPQVDLRNVQQLAS